MSDTRTEETTDESAADDATVIAGSEEARSKAGSKAGKPAAPALGFVGGLRFIWTQLTTMRTALGLLFLLALAAIPGSLVPQQSISPVQVNLFLDQHKTLGPIYDKVGLFNVYTSPWFSAIYLLLFISLIGCIIPRVVVYLRALRAEPPRTPRYLHRMPAYVSTDLPADHRTDAPGAGRAVGDEEMIDLVEAGLRRRRYRVVRQSDGSVSAERGYLREAGNLLFHISLVFVLVGVAVVWLTNFRGTSAVVVGSGFANNLAQYDDFKAGPLFNEKSLTPFSIKVNSFDVQFETGAVQRGAAREFKANVTVTDAPGQKPHNATIQVNHPLRINGSTVHLVAWGYAPVVTVKDGDGNVAYSGPVIFLPQDGNFTSAGAIKAPDARPDRLGFEGLFLPSAVIDNTGPHSVFPDLYNPQLLLNAWSGKPGPETGVPESVYTLDKTGMKQIMDPKNPKQPLRFILRPGYVQKLPGGGSIQLDGVQRWIKLQVGDSPGVYIAIIAIGCAVLGLCFSLFIRPRRVWARLRTTKGSTVFEIAGLDRADARTGLQEDLADLLDDVVKRPGPRTEETT
jgi:cytochrome c biogenesis protein